MHRSRYAMLRLVFAALLVLAIGAAASAQAVDPLPAPLARDVPTVAQPIFPIDGEPFSPGQRMEWSAAESAYLEIRMKNLDTGETWVAPAVSLNCNETNCSMDLGDTADLLFGHTRSGERVRWFVKLFYHGSPAVKGPKATFTVQEVVAPSPLLPGKGVTLQYASNLSWPHHIANEGYVVIVKDRATGATVWTKVVPSTWCEVSNCKLALFDNGAAEVLEANHEYTWRVKAVGATGEKAKSRKHWFVTPMIID